MSPKRRRRGLKAFVIVLVLLGGLLFAVDRVGESLAENQLAKAAAQEAAKYDVRASDTSAEIGGFGFLPQVARGEFSKITVTMQRPTFSSVAAEDLSAEMTGVHVPQELLTGSKAVVTVDTTDVRLRLSPGALTKLTATVSGLSGLSLQISGGKLLAHVKVRGVDATATVRPQAVNGRIRLVVDQLPSELPSVIRKAVTTLLAKGVALPDLPFGATLKEIALDGQAIALTATAKNLQLTAGA
ncbi:DUF2993 domain-containing protein [Kribbella qitaiheensis]|uniref:DUF2993 domain-containing protein n=1 Tax=Kribbella qitaiheensis TaxID=1544730 RepID=A0A7G6WXL9_9ACTN|nr:DUF2993 domain-containing protein [Kribbella qitaiheensis]QNE18734.1 DUF2993 domain-containing protein [Kribbella qitaiheensis]